MRKDLIELANHPYNIFLRILNKFGSVEIRRKLHGYLVIYPKPKELREDNEDDEDEYSVFGATVEVALELAWKQVEESL